MGKVVASTYEIIKEIGSGGGGIVYLANHLRLNKQVVLKADKRKLETRPEILRREVDALKDLSHTYIPQVYDYFVEDETVYTVIDFISGESFDKALKRGTRFEQRDVIKWACQLLEALSYLHKPIHGDPPRGIVHSDIKPANIMLTENGDICLIDFNIALALGEEVAAGLTVGYASPEHYGLDFSGDTLFTNSSQKSTGSFLPFSRSRSRTAKADENSHKTNKSKSLNTLDKDEATSTLGADEATSMLGIDEATSTLGADEATSTLGIDEVTSTLGADEATSTLGTDEISASNKNKRTETLPEILENIKIKVTMSMKPSESTSSKRIVVPDARSDIYSLGATLYHLFSGKRPHRNAFEVKSLYGVVSPQIADIIAKAMNPNPDLRYQSADEMLYAFTHLRENDPRYKKRKKAAMLTAALTAACFLAGVFTSFTGLKRMEAVQRSLTLAEYSANALAEGEKDKAVEYALEAIEKPGLFTPSTVSQVQKALASALGVYDLADGFKLECTAELPSECFKLAISPDGKTGAAVYSFETAVFNAETGEIIKRLPIVKSALSDAAFVNNNMLAYAGEDSFAIYDIKSDTINNLGNSVTNIAVSSDGTTVAGIYRDESKAYVYDIDGNQKAVFDFEGNKQSVVENDFYGDTFADPFDNLISLSSDGQYLAVSFENGALRIYNVSAPQDYIEIYDKSDYTHFEGGFCGKYFAFSASGSTESEFGVINIDELVQTVGLVTDGRIGVRISGENIYISNKSTVVTINPETGEQQEAAYIDADVRDFSADENGLLLVTDKNEYLFYDKNAVLTDRYSGGESECSFAQTCGGYAFIAGRDTPIVKILKKKEFSDTNVFSYDFDYVHDEARINADESRCMLFSYEGFRLYDSNGNMIKEQLMPDKERVYDQQYSNTSGNLAVMYSDALRIYSGQTGELLFEKTNLKSVFYAAYGISIFDGENVDLIDIDNGRTIASEKADGSFAAYCSMVVDDSFLNGRELIGAAETDLGYVFAIYDNNECILYDGNGKELCKAPAQEQSEAFFTSSEVIISPLHGTPAVYTIKNGKKKADLERDAYLTYIKEFDNFLLSEYISAEGAYYGEILDKKNYEAIALLPQITDVSENEVYFDFDKGTIRKTRIYSIDELISMGNSDF